MQNNNLKMNSAMKTNDGSIQSEENMLTQNDTAKVNAIQETILLPGENASSPSAKRAEDWRDLARQIQEETDSTKIVYLVQQLIAKFDEQNARPPRPEAK
jgi:hypothetical protein